MPDGCIVIRAHPCRDCVCGEVMGVVGVLAVLFDGDGVVLDGDRSGQSM